MPRVAKRLAQNGTTHRPHDGPCRGLVGVRCSTDEQLEQYGPKVQTDACLAIAAREGLEIDPEADVVVIAQSVTKYVGASEQAALDGDFYAAIIERLKTGRYCAYLTYDMTRLTRSGVLHQLLLEQEVKKHASRILYANLAGVDTTTPEGETFKVIMAAVNRLRTVLDLARLSSAKRRQALAGYWAGDQLPLGYRLEVDEAEAARRKRPVYRRAPYPPHVEVVTAMLRALVEQRGNPFKAAQALRRAGVIVPDFEPDVRALMARRSATKVMRARVDGGWRITPRMLTAAPFQRAYEGILVWERQEIGRDERLAVVDPELLAEARRLLDAASHRPRGRAASTDAEPLPLTNLLYCVGREDDPHERPLRAGCHPNAETYRCLTGYRNGDDQACLDLRARLIDGPVAEFVLGQLRLGALTGDVVAELEREQADGVAQSKERDQERRRLQREIAALEQNIENLLASEVLTADRYSRMEAQLGLKRAELAGLATPRTTTPGPRQLTAQQVATVRAVLEDPESVWADLPGSAKNDLLRCFLERVEVAHRGALLRVAIRWINGHVQTIEIERPRYVSQVDDRWTAAEDDVLRQHAATIPADELEALLPKRTRGAIVRRTQELGLDRAPVVRRNPEKHRFFTAEEDAVVRRYAAGEMSLDEIRAQLGRTDASVYGRMKVLGIHREGSRSRPSVNWRVVDNDDLEPINCRASRSSRPVSPG